MSFMRIFKKLGISLKLPKKNKVKKYWFIRKKVENQQISVTA